MFLTFIFITAVPVAILFAMGCIKGWTGPLALATAWGAFVPISGVTLLYLSTGFQYKELTDPYK
jgi:hypothetical protein